MDHQHMSYPELDKGLAEAGFDFRESAEVLDEVAEQYHLTDTNGEMRRDFPPPAVAEVYRRLGQAPARKAGRPQIGPEVKTQLPQEEISVLEERAALLGITRTELIRQILRAHIYTGYGIPPEPPGLHAVTDRDGIPWTRGESTWRPAAAAAGIDFEPTRGDGLTWTGLARDRGGLTPITLDDARAWTPKEPTK